MIPGFEPDGNLPPGIHWASWQETVERFGWTEHRLRLLSGLRLALDELRVAGCRTVYVDGSFVTSKTDPADFDACWDAAGILADKLNPALIAYDSVRRGQRTKYGGEFFVADTPANLYGTSFLEYFQRDKGTGEPKGIVAIDLERES